MIAEIQEGEEWIARLTKEKEALALDLIRCGDMLSEYTITNIEYAIDRISNYIAEISVEIGLIAEDYKTGDGD